MCATVMTDEWPERNTRQGTGRRSFPYPALDRYGRKPEMFFCRNCVIYIDNPVVAEKHIMATDHIVDETFL